MKFWFFFACVDIMMIKKFVFLEFILFTVAGAG